MNYRSICQFLLFGSGVGIGTPVRFFVKSVYDLKLSWSLRVLTMNQTMISSTVLTYYVIP
ncbi:uncharacterized protein BYT42DRAFT_587793 [Radiomyces spectabilis]|uniref:uncharacterized protein n=1 Tax=Radiomyces spectabilis TaxID=64574 RepID=UPI0022210E39|nr:uncharacterized protein BYT42DRAFT_587793 [Radiomyces spectabilis]KAI8366760.1 hypothetical protein BYT42DRAFT_587793 [Radiomyces spectabilis]